MSLIKKNVTEAMAAASRANGKKSAGPVTERGKERVRLNAAKHWGRAEVLRPLMPALGEDPAEFESLRAGLYRSLGPGDEFETLLVDDLAETHWHLRRMLRGEAADQAKHRREQMAKQEARDAVAEAGKLHDLARYLSTKIGYAGLEDSPGKFAHIIAFLTHTAELVEAQGFQEEKGVEALRAVYGTINPGLQGFSLISDYLQFSQEEASADEAVRQKHREGFLSLLNQEIAWFEERAARDRLARAELKAPRADCGLVEGTPANAIPHQERLERNFERKWKLLMAYRAAGAAQRTAEESEAAGGSTAESAAPPVPAEDGGEALAS